MDAKSFIVNSRDLGNRWDAEFHQFRLDWQDSASAIKNSIQEELRGDFEFKIVAMLNDVDIFDINTLRIFQPLVRGSRADRDAFIRAAAEYPYLVAAVLASPKMEAILNEKRAALQREAERVTGLQAQLGSMISKTPATPAKKANHKP